MAEKVKRTAMGKAHEFNFYNNKKTLIIQGTHKSGRERKTFGMIVKQLFDRFVGKYKKRLGRKERKYEKEKISHRLTEKELKIHNCFFPN